MPEVTRFRQLLGCLIIATISLLSPIAAAQVDDCTNLASRLTTNIRAQVEPGPGSANNLRDAPGLDSKVIDQISPGERFQVLSGPDCFDGYLWWQVNFDGKVGWTAEYNPATRDYWLEPLTAPVNPSLDDLALCQQPPADYTIVDFDFAQLNARTVAMLDQTTNVYHLRGGLLDFDFRDALVQGSYNEGRVAASFGTHDGGGAVDLSVREPVSRRVMTEEIDNMLRALRIAGYAAWLRDTDELYPDSPIHIHAIAIGDDELSAAARAQIDGPFGYLRGFNGLPQNNGIPLLDTSGEMVICDWMIELGFDDLRSGLD